MLTFISGFFADSIKLPPEEEEERERRLRDFYKTRQLILVLALAGLVALFFYSVHASPVLAIIKTFANASLLAGAYLKSYFTAAIAVVPNSAFWLTTAAAVGCFAADRSHCRRQSARAVDRI